MLESPLATYRRHLTLGQLAYQYDPATQRAVFPPRVLGPGSGNVDLEWRVSSGLGTVHAVTVVHPRGEDPYNVVLVDMDDGFRLMSRVENVPADRVFIGMRVRARSMAGVPVGGVQDRQPPHPVFESLEAA